METDKAAIGALLFILLVVAANFIMIGIVRGAARARKGGFWEAFSKSINPSQKGTDDMDELHRKLEELNKGRKD